MNAGPKSADLLPDAALPSRSGVLADLAQELEELWAEGDSVHPELFFDRNPELLQNKSQVLNWAFWQYCQLAEQGAAPDADAYCARFPNFEHSLRRLIQGFSFAEKNPALFGDAATLLWPEAGDQFPATDGFALLRELGRGAFARVFLAQEPALGNRRVAVKISRFGLTEAQALGKLDHPNVVPVYSVHRDPTSGLSVVCMPYLGSATLCDLLDKAFAAGRRPKRADTILEAARDVHQAREPATHGQQSHPLLRVGNYVEGVAHLGAQLADALAYMHAQGICHRDLKPSNVLLTPDGRPMVLDFNLCSDEQASEQVQGGTFPYMAPEQLRAVRERRNVARPDPRSDLFALGVILYELLTGRYPFGVLPCSLPAEELTEHLLRQQQAGPAPVRQANPRVDERLARLVQQCLAFDAAARPASADDLAEELRRCYLSPARRAGRWLRRHAVAVAAASCLMLMGGAAAVALAPKEPDLVAEGQAAYQKGDYYQAVRHLDTVIERDVREGRTNALAYFTRGRAFLKMAEAQIATGRWSQDVKDLLAQAAMDFSNADRPVPDGAARACRAYCLARLTSHGEAVIINDAAIKAGFDTAAVYNNRGHSHARLGANVEALRDFRTALLLDPSLHAANASRAFVYAQLVLSQPPTPPVLKELRREEGVSAEGDWRHEFAVRGLKDIDRALATGPGSAELYRTGTRLAALASRTQPDPWREKVFEYFRQARQLGASPATVVNPEMLKEGKLFAAFSKDPNFQALLTPVSVQTPTYRTPQLLDPVQD